MKKRLCLLLSLVLVMLFAGCAAPQESADLPVAYSAESGYSMKNLPFGSDAEAVEAALGSTLTLRGEKTEAFPFANYITDSAIEYFGTKGLVDVQIGENGLYAFTFASRPADSDTKAAYDEADAAFRSAFGEPDKIQEASGTTFTTWTHEASHTFLQTSYAESGTNAGLFQFGVFVSE